MTSLSSFALALCLCLCLTFVNGNKYDEALSSTETPNYKEYCVIGAGPGGLQMAYFLENAARDYIVFEKGYGAGTFYLKYPIHRLLISINKRNTGKTNKEFNFRHDWNSLVSHDESLQMTKYSEDFFPPADTLVQYLNDFAAKLNLKIQYNSTMHDVMKREDKLFQMWDQHDNVYTCKYVIMATGIAKPKEPKFQGHEYVDGYEDLSVNRSDFEKQSVLILGRGNAAHETAQHIMGNTNVIHMMSRSTTRLAWATHYVGDLRALNNGILDTYQLKSLDGLFEGDVNELIVTKSPLDGRLYILHDNKTLTSPGQDKLPTIANDAVRDGYDRIIRCLGFEFDFDIFHPSLVVNRAGNSRKGKYPRISFLFEALGTRNLYFAGTNAHSLDHRKSAGGFIHGYRYTARSLHHALEWKNHGVQWPAVKFNNPMDLIPHILKRVNEASDIYQMFSALCDVVIFGEDKISSTYLEAYPCSMLSRLPRVTGHPTPEGIMVIAMEYGKNFSGAGKDPFHDERVTNEPSQAHQSNFLHPVMYYYNHLITDQMFIGKHKDWILPVPDRILHIIEDFVTKFDAPNPHVLMLRRFLEDNLGVDLRHWFAEYCFMFSLLDANLPIGCNMTANDGSANMLFQTPVLDGIFLPENLLPIPTLTY